MREMTAVRQDVRSQHAGGTCLRTQLVDQIRTRAVHAHSRIAFIPGNFRAYEMFDAAGNFSRPIQLHGFLTIRTEHAWCSRRRQRPSYPSCKPMPGLREIRSYAPHLRARRSVPARTDLRSHCKDRASRPSWFHNSPTENGSGPASRSSREFLTGPMGGSTAWCKSARL